MPRRVFALEGRQVSLERVEGPRNIVVARDLQVERDAEVLTQTERIALNVRPYGFRAVLTIWPATDVRASNGLEQPLVFFAVLIRVDVPTVDDALLLL